MPLDGIFLHYLTNELKTAVVGSRVEKVHQPSKDTLLLLLRARSGASKLLLSASANSPRLHLTAHAPENPASPPMLCMLLRKYLCGAVITDLTQDGLDRSVRLRFAATNEIGDPVQLALQVEIMAKHSNIILLNETQGVIVDAVKRVDWTQSGYRQILPGLPFVPPPSQGKLDLTATSADTVAQLLRGMPEKQLSSALLQVLEGVSPLISRELSARSGGDCRVADLSDAQWDRLNALLAALSVQIKGNGGTPYLLKDPDGKPKDFSYTDITQYGFSLAGERQESFSALLDRFYLERDRIDRTRQRAADLFKLLSNATARITKKLALQKTELAACADREALRIKAELINANLGRLEKGALFYDLENYYDNNAILRIPANPALSPAANAQKYYKEYRKAKMAEQMLTNLIAQGEQELLYLDSVADALTRASTGAELDAIREELQDAGYSKRRGREKRKRPAALPPLEYTSPDGLKILVGRNNLQNDQLSLKTAKGSDLWLHAQKMPGSHVVVFSEGRPVPPTTIEYAAALAAYHSKGREATLVEVDYTLAKHLKKPQGARPGKVIYHVYNSLSVKPQDG